VIATDPQPSWAVAEPVTVVLSERGWIRAGKGHDLDPTSLPYKSGDAFLHAARGRSNQLAVFIDSMGRTYSLPAHELPSAKGHGEPLTAFTSPAPGATFVAVMMGDPEDLWLLSTDDGYGFIAKLEDWARSLGCVTLRGVGRPGWARIVKKFGGMSVDAVDGLPAWERRIA